MGVEYEDGGDVVERFGIVVGDVVGVVVGIVVGGVR